MYMICAQYVICWTGPPVTPAGTALQLEHGVGRHQCCSQPAQVHCVHFNHLVCVPSFFALIPLSSFLSFSPVVSPTPSLPHFLTPSPLPLPSRLPLPSPLLPPSPSLPLPPPSLPPPSSPLPPPPSLSPPSPSLPPSLPLSCPPVVMYMYTSRDISGKITHTIYPPCTDLLES